MDILADVSDMSMRRTDEMIDDGTLRIFGTGATRDTSEGKPDYEGFLSPLVLRAFGAYMNGHRIQSDGTIRASDNWQKGISKNAYMSSLWRHFLDMWTLHRGYDAVDPQGNHVDFETAICGILFNAMGYLHEELKINAHAGQRQESAQSGRNL